MAQKEADRHLYSPLALIDEFVQAHNDGHISEELELTFAKAALPDYSVEIPLTVAGILGKASEFYEHMARSSSPANIFDFLQNGGAVIKKSESVYVQTDDGSLNLSQVSRDAQYAKRDIQAQWH